MDMKKIESHLEEGKMIDILLQNGKGMGIVLPVACVDKRWNEYTIIGHDTIHKLQGCYELRSFFMEHMMNIKEIEAISKEVALGIAKMVLKRKDETN